MNDIPRWAAIRAYDRAFGTVEGKGPSDDYKVKYITGAGAFTGRALAEMIVKYEEPPVDPDEVVVNDIINSWLGIPSSLEDRKKHWPLLFGRAVERYKNLKETKGES